MGKTIQDTAAVPWLTQDDTRKPIETSPKALLARAKAPPNLAIYDKDGSPHEVVARVAKLANAAYSSYRVQRQSGKVQENWEKADSYYWMAMKEHRMPELTRAKVSAASFYKVVRRNAAGANIASFPAGADFLPVIFAPKISPFEPSEIKQQKAWKTQALNAWALYCMQKARVDLQRSEAYHRVYKYSNAIYYVPYDFQIEVRKRYENYDPNEQMNSPDGSGSMYFIHRDTGATSPLPHPPELREVEYDYVSKDNVGFYNINIEDVWLDDNIDDMDRQTNLLWRSAVTRMEIWRESKAGKYLNTDKITMAHKYNFYSEQSQVMQERRDDAGKSVANHEDTELYERWQCWMMLPKIEVKLNAKGEATDLTWDQNAEPRRYLFEFIGQIYQQNIIVRFCESPYWSNGVPFIAAHSHDDDCGFYHRGLLDLLEDNMVQEQVAKGQAMDGRTLRNFRPMMRLKGRCFTKDMRITANKIFEVSSPDALKPLDMGDASQVTFQTLQDLRAESEMLGNTPRFMLGEAMGSRTSATEFQTIRTSSESPSLSDIKSLNVSIWGGVMRKVAEYAPQFLSQELIILMAGQQIKITPDEFNDFEFDLQEVATTEFENKQTAQQVIINAIQVLSSPMFQGITNPAAILVKFFSQFPAIFPNPEELISKNPQVQAALLEYQTQSAQGQNQMQQSLNGNPPPPQEGEGGPGMPSPGGTPPGVPPQGGGGGAGGIPGQPHPGGLPPEAAQVMMANAGRMGGV